MNNPVISLRGIGKIFPGVRALNKIDLDLYPGSIHAVMGENGAGKSTLMKILAGDYICDEGKIFITGEQVSINSPNQAQQLGIGMIHQELTLLPDRTIAQNILLGREPVNRWGMVDKHNMYALARENLGKLNLDLNPDTLVSTLPIALRQMVEITKALSLDARVLILDEPTSSLTETETKILFNIMRQLKDKDIALIYISHRLEEVFAIADTITVLRDGSLIGTSSVEECTPDKVVRMMVGRDLKDMYARDRHDAQNSLHNSEVLLEVNNISGTGFQNISLKLNAGEVLGVAGLVGAGRSEFARALFGLDPVIAGTIRIKGQEVSHMTASKSMKKGLVYVPEDRRQQGLFINLSVRRNLTVNILNSLSRLGLLLFRQLNNVADELVARLSIRPPDTTGQIRNLSGGNQQKAMIAKWLSLNPDILILDEPTRGIDVAAKADIYTLIDSLSHKGVGVIAISSELPEILGISDRILVMRNGSIVGELPSHDVSQDTIMHLAAGGNS